MANKRSMDAIITEHAQRTGIDPDLAWAIWQQESSGRMEDTPDRFEPHLNMSSYGPFQVLPSTAKAMGFDGNPLQLRDPEVSAQVAFDYLKYLSDRFKGDRARIIAAYNQGDDERDPTGAFKNQKYVDSVLQQLERRKKEAGKMGALENTLSGGSVSNGLSPTAAPADRTRVAAVDAAFDEYTKNIADFLAKNPAQANAQTAYAPAIAEAEKAPEPQVMSPIRAFFAGLGNPQATQQTLTSQIADAAAARREKAISIARMKEAAIAANLAEAAKMGDIKRTLALTTQAEKLHEKLDAIERADEHQKALDLEAAKGKSKEDLEKVKQQGRIELAEKSHQAKLAEIVRKEAADLESFRADPVVMRDLGDTLVALRQRWRSETTANPITMTMPSEEEIAAADARYWQARAEAIARANSLMNRPPTGAPPAAGAPAASPVTPLSVVDPNDPLGLRRPK